ncbi:MAG: biotin/lipoate--protein ligase family protein [Beijerinckiaceae bacterium]
MPLPRVTPSLDLPPAFRVVTLREAGDAFAHAQAIAAYAGAGTLVWVRRFDLAEFAVVLEPEESLASARRVFHAGMNALADALAVHCPPERPLVITWPGTVRFDTAIVGGGQLAWPHDTAENAVPDWIIFGAMLRLHGTAEIAPGMVSIGASLFDTGFEDADSAKLVESFSRHFMAQIDAWQGDGFRHVAETYCARLADGTDVRRALDVNGDMLERPSGKVNPVTRHALLPHLMKKPAWMDANSGEPVL